MRTRRASRLALRRDSAERRDGDRLGWTSVTDVSLAGERLEFPRFLELAILVAGKARKSQEGSPRKDRHTGIPGQGTNELVCESLKCLIYKT